VTKLHCRIIIGEAAVRKGSLVRALTGVGNGRNALIALKNGQWLELEATVSSLNEGANPPEPSNWVRQQINGTKGRKNLLLSLRLTVGHGLNAQDYIEALDKGGANIESIISLGQNTPNWVPPYGCPYGSVPVSSQTPTALTAHQVREFWGWA